MVLPPTWLVDGPHNLLPSISVHTIGAFKSGSALFLWVLSSHALVLLSNLWPVL